MFSGSIPALVTPFSGGRVATDTFAEFVEWQIAEGSSALVPCGTTGEVATLTADEHRELIAHTVQIAKGRAPVIAGCGTYSTAASIERVRAAADVGADAALVVVPSYNKPSQAGLAAHFTAIADASPLPIVVYNVPSRTVADISVETLTQIVRHPRIVAVKMRPAISLESRRSASRLAKLRPTFRERRHGARLQRHGRSGVYFGYSKRRPAALRRLPEGDAGRALG